MISLNNPHIFAYSRENESQKLIVISSFSNKSRKFKLTENLSDKDIVLSNFDNHEKKLKPFETRIYLVNKK